MEELTREEKKQKTREIKEKMKKVEQYAKYRRAQEDLRENGIEDLSENSKHEILRAMEQQMTGEQVKLYKALQLKVVQMNYFGSVLGLVSAAILPRQFRKYHQLKLIYRVPLCVGLFLTTQKAAAFKSICAVDDFEVEFIQLHSNDFLQQQYET